MTPFTVTASFDPVAERWAFQRVGGRTDLPLVEVHHGAYVARSIDGALHEMVLDATSDRGLPPDSARLVNALLGSAATDEFQRRSNLDNFNLEASPAPSVGVATAGPSTRIADEPGVPRRQTDGSYVVPAGTGDAHLVAGGSTISIVVSAGDSSTAEWITISDAATGTLLASARLRDIGDGRRAADLTFGLPIAPDDLFVMTTHHPLEAVSSREVRRAAWARSLLAESAALLHRKPVTARRRASKAAEIGRTIHDHALVADAERTVARATKWAYGLGATALLVVGGAVGFGLTRLTQSDPQQPVAPADSVYYANCDAARAAGPTPILRDQPGYRPGLDRDGDGKACEG